MITDNRPLAFVRTHPFQAGAYLVYVPDLVPRGEEWSTEDSDDCEEDCCSYVARIAHDAAEITQLIAPHYKLASAGESEHYPGGPLPVEVLALVRARLDFWPLPPFISECMRTPIEPEDPDEYLG